MMAPAATFEGDPLQDMLDQQKDDGYVHHYLIVGTKGAVATDVFARTLRRWEFSDSPTGLISKMVEDRKWSAEEDHIFFHNTLAQTRDIVRRVAAGLPPMTSARDAYETMRLCFAADESADSGQIVKL